MKKILIAGYESQTENYRRAFAALHVRTKTLGVPAADADFSKLSSCDGLVLPGGGDISPALLSCESKGFRNIDEALDRLQLALLHAFAEAKKPVLGICKGLQLINVGFGGGLIPDLPAPSLALHAWEGADRVHVTKAAAGTFPALLYGPRPVVNSAHHQAVGTVGAGLRVAQYAPDFVVEALYHERLPILGVQWHPERLCSSSERAGAVDGRRVLEYFVSLV